MSEDMTAPTCEDCTQEVSLSVAPYGTGIMLVINCPNCGISYDTNVDKKEVNNV